jgi:uncharacterized metal-binding protein
LENVTIGSRVNAIGNYAFSGCSSLEEITNKAAAPQTVHFTVFGNVNKVACTLNVPAASAAAYRAAAEWKDFF